MFNQSEQSGFLNNDILGAITNRLAERGIASAVLKSEREKSPRSDAGLELQVGAQKKRYDVEIMTRVSESRIAATAALHRDSAVLIATRHMPRVLADHCRAIGVDFVDTAGNMLLRGDDGWITDVEGRKPPTSIPGASERALRAFAPTGVRVLAMLLTDPGLCAEPYRSIAMRSRTSLGTVNWVMAELLAERFIDEGMGARRLVRTRTLFDRWVEAYGITLYRRLLVGAFTGEFLDDLVLGLAPVSEDVGQWGGETAAFMFDGTTRPATATLYVDSLPTRLIQERRLQKTSGGPVTFRERFWKPFPGRTVPSVLVYADLVHSGDPRQMEAAIRLRAADPALVRLDAS